MSLYLPFHNGSAAALKDSVLYRLPKDRLLDLLRTRPNVGYAYYRGLSGSIARTFSAVQNLVFRKANERLCAYPAMLAGNSDAEERRSRA